ncbi:hypothetical protein GCM10007874_14800 [Labrys miyagiensis]|uniref:Uncharacterized protein n=2 Tax=Labrys miyagiensis TaxID=346912 RepID=A0ABQ6CDX6_9HYPH|nr:hypothetical protein GCM10007874_14800 [Labrys miyagiensis]
MLESGAQFRDIMLGVKIMSRITYYVVIPFIRTPEGELLGLEAEEAPDVSKAKIHAFNMVGDTRGEDTIVGAVAFSRSGDLGTGRFEDALILARYGETPEDVEGM